MDPRLLTDHGNGTGAIMDTKDERDYQWGPNKEIGFGSAPFDWNQGFNIEDIVGLIPIKDQGQSGSCGGQAWSYQAAVLEAVATGSLEDRSAKFIYAQTYVPGGGSAGRTNAEVYRTKGAATEGVLTSYENGKPPSEAFMERRQDITVDAYADAKKDLALSYANVSVDIDTIAQAIRDNHGVILGIYGSNNGTWLDPTPVPPAPNVVPWAHWVYAGKAKIVNGRKFIGIANSWGKNCGENGWQWLSQEYFATRLNAPYGAVIWQAWTHLYNPNPVTSLPSFVFLNNLQLGSSGTDVVALQMFLQGDGEFPTGLVPTGYFGSITETGVKRFQIKYGICPPTDPGYGMFGPRTRAAVNKLGSQVAVEGRTWWQSLLAYFGIG